MSSAPKPRAPYYVRWLAGEARSAIQHVKAYVFDDSAYDGGCKVFMQLRELVLPLGFSLRGTYWWAWYRHHGRGASWDEDFKTIAAEKSDFRPSLKQAAAQGLCDEEKSWCSQEVLVSPAVALLHLLDWSCRLRRGHGDEACKELDDFLRKVLARVDDEVPPSAYALPDEDVNSCLATGGVRGSCKHCLQLHDSLIGDGLTIPKLAEVLPALWRKRNTCPLVNFWVGSFVAQVGVMIERALLPQFGWQPHAEGIKTARGEKRRLRVDEELKGATVCRALGAKRFRTASQMVRSGAVDIHPSSCAEVEENVMRKYWSGLLNIFTGKKQIHISADESVVGGESTMLVAAFDVSSGISGWFLPQVMPALRKLAGRGKTEDGGELDEVVEAVNVALQMGALAKTHENVGPDLADSRKTRKVEREASLQMIRAWDHSLLVSTGRGLQFFVQGRPGPTRLKAGEKRWVVDCALQRSYEVPEGVASKKICRFDASTSSKRFEVPQRYSDQVAPILTISSDECAVNLAAYQFIAHRLRARVVLLRDQAHRCWRDFKLATTDAGFWPCILELMHAMNCRHGPWTSQAWFRQCKESIALHLSKAGMGCPLFLALKDRLCVDMGLHRSYESGSVEELKACWEALKASECVGRKGTRVNLVRWFEFVTGFEEFQKDYWTHLFEYCLVLLYSGTVTNLAEFPIFEAHSVPLEWKQSLKGKSDGSKVTMQASGSESKAAEQRTKAVNSVHMAAMIMGQGGQFRRGRVLLCVGRVVHKHFGQELKGAYKKDMTFNYHLNHASEGHSLVFRKLGALLTSLPSLEEMLFDFTDLETPFYHDQVSPTAASSSDGGLFLQPLDIHDKHSDETQWAELLWSLVVSTLRHRGLSMSQFVDLPLGQMVMLLSKNKSVVKRGLEKQRLNWEVLQAAENKQFVVPGLARVLDNICFVEEIVIREMLVQLAEHDFAYVSPVVEKSLCSIYKGFANSVVVERGFQKLQDFGREQKDKSMSRVRRWYCLHQSKLLAEFEKEEVAGEHQVIHEDVPRRLPKTLFHALGQACTMPDKKTNEILKTGRAEWSHCSAQGLQLQSGAWNLVKQAHQGKCWEKLADGWHALLLQEGCVAYEVEMSADYIVLKKCEYGALLWPAVRTTWRRCVFYTPQRAEGTVCIWRAVLGMSGWKAIPTQVLSPIVTASLFSGTDLRVGVMLMQTGAQERIEIAAARWGFRGMADNFLDKLLRLWGLGDLLKGKDSLKGVLPKAEALIKHLLPDVSKEDLASFLKKRSGLANPQCSSVLMSGENLQQSESTFDSSDLQVAREFKAQQKAATTVHCSTVQFLQQRGYLSLAQAGAEIDRVGGVPPQDAAQKAAPTKVVWSWNESHLKTVTPPVAGATIQQVINSWTTCWVARYKGAKPKASHTVSYGGKSGVTSEQAARACMLWLWNAYISSNPGQSCPYDFAAMPLEEEGGPRAVATAPARARSSAKRS